MKYGILVTLVISVIGNIVLAIAIKKNDENFNSYVINQKQRQSAILREVYREEYKSALDILHEDISLSSMYIRFCLEEGTRMCQGKSFWKAQKIEIVGK